MANFGVILSTGYLAFKAEGLDSTAEAYDYVMNGHAIFGSFNLPASPGHRPAAMRLNPAHVVGVIELPERK